MLLSGLIISPPDPSVTSGWGPRTSWHLVVFLVQASIPLSHILLLSPCWSVCWWCLAQSPERPLLSPSEASSAEFGPALNGALGSPRADDPVPSLLSVSSAASGGSVYLNTAQWPICHQSLSTRSLPCPMGMVSLRNLRYCMGCSGSKSPRSRPSCSTRSYSPRAVWGKSGQLGLGQTSQTSCQ